MSGIKRESIEEALENDRCGVCGSVDHFREDCPRAAADRAKAAEDRTDWWGEPAATDRDQQRAGEIATSVERDAPWLGGPFHVQQALIARIALALAQERAAARADADARWTAAVEGLAEFVEGVGFGTRPPHSLIAARLRGLTGSSEEQQ